jgi:hypothetical protein
VAVALAVSMSVVAWRLLREQRLRSAVRVQTLAALAGGEDDALDASERSALRLHSGQTPPPGPETEPEVEEERDWDASFRQVDVDAEAAPVESPAEIFEAAAVRGAPARRWLALTAVALTMAAGIASLYVMRSAVGAGDAPGSGADPGPVEATTVGMAAHPRPLELMSLGHFADPGGTFTVNGSVRNPADAPTVGAVMVVVYLFDQQGRYFASGRAALNAARLTPGEQTTFTIRIPSVAGVARYRVGFRSPQGDVVAHIDKRGGDAGATVGAL